MPIYQIKESQATVYTIQVEADSLEEAIQIYQDGDADMVEEELCDSVPIPDWEIVEPAK